VSTLEQLMNSFFSYAIKDFIFSFKGTY